MSSEARESKRKQTPETALKAPRRALAEPLAHHQTQVKARFMDQDSLENVRVTSQVNAAQTAGLVAVSHTALHLLATPASQPLAARPLHPSVVGVGGVPLDLGFGGRVGRP